MPPAGSYGASDIRAQIYGLFAYDLLEWGRGLVRAIDSREQARETLNTRQMEERTAALARLKALQDGEK